MSLLKKFLGDIQARFLGLGGATGDTTNVLSVRGPGSLFDGADAGHQIRINKDATSDDANMTFQTAFSTKALMGLSGGDDFTIEVGSSFTTALVIDEVTGEVDLPATPPWKFTINKSTRVYCYDDARWVSLHDDTYGANHNSSESGGTSTDPLAEWEHMGEYVREGTVIHDLAMFGRLNSNTAVSDLEVSIRFSAPDPLSRWDSTGFDSDDEDTHTELWRGFWKAGGLGVAETTQLIADQIRRTFPLNFTAPSDGQIRIYIKPVNVDPRPDTATDYFYCSYSWLLSYR